MARHSSVIAIPRVLRRGSKVGSRLSVDEPSPKDPLPNMNKVRELLLGLASELQIAILEELDKNDIFVLRRTCRAFYQLTELHQSVLVRQLLLQHEEIEATALHSFPSNSGEMTFGFYYTFCHRARVVSKLSKYIADFIAIKIYRCTTDAHRLQFESSHTNIRNNVFATLFHLFYYLEAYRDTLAETDCEFSPAKAVKPTSDADSRHSVTERALLSRYRIAELKMLNLTFNLLSTVVLRKFRPPTYAGKIERRLRGWSKPPADKEEIVQLLILGGLEEVTNLLEVPGYAGRKTALEIVLRKICQPDNHASMSRSGPAAQTGESDAKYNKEFLRKIERKSLSSICPLQTASVIELLPNLHQFFSTAKERYAAEIAEDFQLPTVQDFINTLRQPWVELGVFRRTHTSDLPSIDDAISDRSNPHANTVIEEPNNDTED